MDTPNMPQTNSPATYLVAGIVLLLIGVIIGTLADPYLPASLSNTQKGYQSGFTAARTLAENSSAGGSLKVSNDIRSLSGTVTAIQGNTFTMHVTSLNNPFDVSTPVDRIVDMTASTTVMKIVLKSPAVYQSELSLYQNKKKAGETPPSPFSISGAKMTDIKIGNTVTATSLVNIKTLSEFSARYVQIMVKSGN